MQTRETQLIPYEFLVRWNDQGELQGAHIILLGKVFGPDGKLLAAQPMLPQSVGIGVQQGFPLAEILEQIQITALEKIDSLTAELEAEQQLNQQLKAQIAELEKGEGT